MQNSKYNRKCLSISQSLFVLLSNIQSVVLLYKHWHKVGDHLQGIWCRSPKSLELLALCRRQSTAWNMLYTVFCSNVWAFFFLFEEHRGCLCVNPEDFLSLFWNGKTKILVKFWGWICIGNYCKYKHKLSECSGCNFCSNLFFFLIKVLDLKSLTYYIPTLVFWSVISAGTVDKIKCSLS